MLSIRAGEELERAYPGFFNQSHGRTLGVGPLSDDDKHFWYLGEVMKADMNILSKRSSPDSFHS